MEKIIAVIVDYETTPYLSEDLDENGRNSFDLVLDKVSKLSIPYYIFSSTGRKGTFPFSGGLHGLLKCIESELPEFEHLLFFHSDMPLVDLPLTEKIIFSHLENIADYTFAEHYPDGFAPFMIQHAAFKKIQMVSYGNNEDYGYKSIERLLHLDINSYDVEMVLAPADLRIIRDAFRVSEKRNFLLVKNFLKIYKESEDIYEFFKKNPVLMRPQPSYIILEPSSDCNQACLYCPFTHRNNQKQYMPAEKFALLLQEFKKNFETVKIELSGYGEPLLNPEFNQILTHIGKYPEFQFILETNGTLLSPFIDQISATPNLTVIISMDAPDNQLYEQLRGKPDFEKAEESIEKLFNKKAKIYLQLTRMHDNEEQLEAFLKRWRVYKDRILIQKYNDFCKRMPDRKVVDLSPLTRFACWKLQREIYIHADGTASLCSQDYEKKQVLGNVFDEPFKSIWQKQDKTYQAHWEEKYPKFCEKCDQWYIFSF